MRQITAVEIIVSYVSLGWAVALFSNPRMFASAPQNWKVANLVGDEWVFGCVVLLLALIKILGIAINSVRLRRLGLNLSAFFWIFVSVCLLMGKGYFDWSTGVAAYSGYGILCLWSSKEVGVKIGGADKRGAGRADKK